jgi:hypothetical protein
MTTTLTIIMFIMSTTGTVMKQTTETRLKGPSQCIAVQDKIIQKQHPANVRLVSVICSTTGKI